MKIALKIIFLLNIICGLYLIILGVYCTMNSAELSSQQGWYAITMVGILTIVMALILNKEEK